MIVTIVRLNKQQYSLIYTGIVPCSTHSLIINHKSLYPICIAYFKNTYNYSTFIFYIYFNISSYRDMNKEKPINTILFTL